MQLPEGPLAGDNDYTAPPPEATQLKFLHVARCVLVSETLTFNLMPRGN